MIDIRKLDFKDLDQAFQEAESLSVSGYRSVGKWDLSQCCGHLNCWLGYPMDGFQEPGWPMGMALWLMKNTIGKKQLRRILATGFRNGLPTLPTTVP